MALVEFEGGAIVPTGSKKKKGQRRGPAPVPVFNGRPPATHYTAPGSAGRASDSPPSDGGGKGGGGGGGGVSGAERRAVARENAAKRKAGQRYVEQAHNLDVQIRALKHALRIDFKRGLRGRLANIDEVLRDQDRALLDGFRERRGSLRGAARDNEKAASQQSAINTGNQVRERNSALSEAMLQGAGESDAMRAQMMSLRNWQANQSEVNRSYFDSLRSINSALTDLNVDTRSARLNMENQANSDREQLWNNYYNQRSETFTQLGNVLGQKADYLASAKEMGVGKGGGKAKKAAGTAFMGASKELGKSWDNPGNSKRLMRWEGAKPVRAENSLSKLGAAQTVDLGDKKPEGATLRKW